MKFDWDEGKRQWLLRDRNIDFAGVLEIFDGRPCYTVASARNLEDRFITVAKQNSKLFAVVWMWRGDAMWLITARRAWKSEERRYRVLQLEDRDNG